MGQSDHQRDTSTTGYITAPVLDWVIYTPRLREIIRNLRSNNDFRAEGLRRLHWQQIGIVAFGVIMGAPIYFFSEYSYEPYVVFAFIFFIYSYTTYNVICRYLIPFSTGELVKGKILDLNYDDIPIYTSGWIIKYEFWIGSTKRIKNKIGNISKKEMRPFYPQKGGDIDIFYDPKNPQSNTIYATGHFISIAYQILDFKSINT